MAISFDRQREKYVVRVTANGKRVFGGRHVSFDEAQVAEKRLLYSLGPIQIPEDTSLLEQATNYFELLPEPKWLAPFRRLQTRLFKKKHEAKLDVHLASVKK